jgi:hypothetical protein
MQVKVPKFIEIEDKVVFGMTWKQFLSVGMGLGGGILANMILEPYIGVPFMLICILGGIVLAFVKINERPFVVFLGSAWRYFYNPHSYIWKRVPNSVRFEREKSISTTASPESGLRPGAGASAATQTAKSPEEQVGDEAVIKNAQAKIAEIAKLLDH